MLELLLTLATNKAHDDYPWSGPGPKSLSRGSEALGYFGEVSSQELMTLSSLREQLNFNLGTDFPSWPGTWVKMFLDGKVIFFPTRLVATGISWNDLYNAGIVYGTNDNGRYPTTTPTNQLRYVGGGGAVYKVRNFKAGVDPSALGGVENLSSTTNADTINSEWYRIAATIITPVFNTWSGPNWGLYTQPTQLIPNSSPPFAWAQETRGAATTNSLTINNSQVAPSNVKTSLLGWFPVLEVVPDAQYLFPITHVSAIGTNMVPPITTLEVIGSIEKPTDFSGTFNGVAPMGNVTVEYTV